MKKTTFLFLMLFSICSFGQVTVELQNLAVNGQPITSETINFGGNQTVNLTFDIKLSTSNGSTNNVFGNLFLFFTSANFANPYQVGFQSVTFMPPYGEITKYTANFYSLTITLNRSNFTSSGGTFYAEYKNNNGSTYKSSTYQVAINSGGTNPGNPGGPVSYSEVVPYGGVPILGELPVSDGYKFEWLNVHFGGDGGAWTDPNAQIISQTKPLHSLFYGNGAVKIRQFDIQTNQYVGFSSGTPTYIIYSPMPFRQDNSSGQNIIYRNIAVSNNISTTKEYLIPTYSNGVLDLFSMRPSEIIGDQARVRRIDYNGNVNTFDANNYQWQKRLLRPYSYSASYPEEHYKWENIPNATNINYRPPFIISGHRDAIQYRRLINHTNQTGNQVFASASSNVVTVYPISISSSINNTICCDAEYYLGDKTNPIIGSTPVTQQMQNGPMSYRYQWQIGSIRGDVLNWTNIENSNTKDLLPYKSGMRINEVNQYRRFVITGDYKFYLSDPVEIKWYDQYPNSSRTVQPLKESNKLEINVHPNPTTSIITIISENNLSIYNINIIDATGRIIISKEPTLIENNSVDIDLSPIPSGIYTLVLENNLNTITKKLVKI